MTSRRSTLVALLALGASCSSSPSMTARSRADGGDAANGGDAAGGGGMTAATWVADLTAAYCAWAIRCGRFSGEAACTAYMGPRFAAVNFNAPPAAVLAVSKGTAAFDPSQAGACLTSLASLDCDQDLLGGTVVLAEACVAVFSGSVPDGGACIDDVECGSGSMCLVVSTQTCGGKCTPVPAGTCRTNNDCPAGQFCAAVPIQGSGLSGSGSCEMIVPPGEASGDPCGMPTQCGPGLYCVGGPAPARCGPATGLASGATCGGGLGPFCAAGLACVSSDDGQTSTCMAPAKLGDPCTALFQCGAQYESNDLVCDEARTHTCVHRASTGPCKIVGRQGTCDPATSYCDAASGTCKPVIPTGEACVFPASGIDPCALWNSCSGPGDVCASLLSACTPS